MKRVKPFRTERDTIGIVNVPKNAYYGAQTVRATLNFPISGIKPKRVFIKHTALIKLAAAIVNSSLGLLEKRKSVAIVKAAKEAASGKLDAFFVVDVYQAGAGTSHNMNCNEVIANRALEILRRKRGDYNFIHPNDHVNMSQSTNDVFPTAMRLSALESTTLLLRELNALEKALSAKASEFKSILKSGRTHLQDAVPITLGQEFTSYATAIEMAAGRIEHCTISLKELGIGGSAVGTGLNTHPRYASKMIKTLSKLTGVTTLKQSKNTFYSMSSMAPFASLSGEIRNLSLELIRLSNDFRLLSSGPRTGFGEITLPPVQPGSSIMPGKVNPVMAEMLAMTSYQAIGNDITIASAAAAGQLELNVMMPVINYNLLQTLEILTNAIAVFTEKCVKGIRANKAMCRNLFEDSIGLATVLNPYIGYEKAARVAKESYETGKTVRELILEKKILTENVLNKILSPKNVTSPALTKIKTRKR